MAKHLFLTLFFLSGAVISQAQWQTDLRLTNDPGSSYTSFNNAWCIAASGSYVYVVWYETRDGNREIYFKRSTDGGSSWGADTRLTNDPAFSLYPSIAVSGSNVYVAWYDSRDSDWEIYFKRSTDGGASWGADTRLTTNVDVSWYPSITVSGSLVHVVWEDYRDGNWEIYYKRSTDGGASWGADIRLTNNSAYSYSTSVSVAGLVVHVVWIDYRNGNEEIYYKRSTDGGENWGTDTRLSNNTSISQYPSVSVSGQSVHVVWQDDRSGNREIYYKLSTDGGSSWGADTRLTNYSGSSYSSSVTVSGQTVHVVWNDDRDGNLEIYYKRSADGGSTWGSDTRLTNNSAVSNYPFVAVSGSVVHVMWEDNRDGNYEVYYKRDPTGNITGINVINSEITKEFLLDQNYPNPFNPETKIKFGLPKNGNVKLTVYDVSGRKIEELVNQKMNAGTFEVTWDGSNLSSGVYFYKLESEGFVETKKMILVK